MGQGDTLINAAVGAAVTIGLSFSGFSPLIGGLVAGFLQSESMERGAKVGAISGLIALIPLVLFGLFVFGLVTVLSPALPGGPELLVIFVMLPVGAIWVVGLSAAGGYIGAYIQQERDN